jgi:hypothetical protein
MRTGGVSDSLVTAISRQKSDSEKRVRHVGCSYVAWFEFHYWTESDFERAWVGCDLCIHALAAIHSSAGWAIR